MTSPSTEETNVVRCPTCGQPAHRQYIEVANLSDVLAARCRKDAWVLQTSCPACDYRLAFCPRSGAVLEACTF